MNASDSQPSSKLLRLARAGDSDAWDWLYRRYRLPLLVYLKNWSGSMEGGMDLLQETFVQAHRYRDRLPRPESAGAWLFAIGRQKAIQAWRKSCRQVEVDALSEAEEDLADGVAVEEWVMDKEDRERFLECLASLAPMKREVLTLHFLEELSIEQISELIGVSPGTVKSRIYHAKMALKQKLERILT